MDWLDELAEISKKDLKELTGEDMAKLITPLISFSKFSSDEFPLNRNKYHETILGYLENFSAKVLYVRQDRGKESWRNKEGCAHCQTQ